MLRRLQNFMIAVVSSETANYTKHFHLKDLYRLHTCGTTYYKERQVFAEEPCTNEVHVMSMVLNVEKKRPIRRLE